MKNVFSFVVAALAAIIIFIAVFVKVGWLPNFINIEQNSTEVVSDKTKTEIFKAEKVYRDGDNAIIEDDGGYKVVVNLYSWETEVYHNGKKESKVDVRGLYSYTSNLNNIKDKNKFVKTKIFKYKDGRLKAVKIILENNKHKKDFEVNY